MPNSNTRTSDNIGELLQNLHHLNTRWCIISGAPCSGKTSVIEELAHRGFRTNPDISRSYFEEVAAKGNDAKALRYSGDKLHRELFRRMLINAMQLPPDELIFHDYGLPDNVAFRLEDGLGNDQELIQSCKLIRYKKVFLLAPAAFKRDEIRFEDAAYQARLGDSLRKVYRTFDYNPVDIPLINIAERCEMILKSVFSETEVSGRS